MIYTVYIIILLFLSTSFSEKREAGISHTWIWVQQYKTKNSCAFRDNRQSHAQKRELCFFFVVMSFVCLRFNQQEELSYNVLFTFLTLLLGTDITAHFVYGSYLTCTVHYIISVWNGKFFILKQILVKLLESKHVFLCQTTDKEAPGLVRMHTMAYLSGFPGSLKETEQLRVKLPAVVTSKIKQVKLLNWDNQYNAMFEMTTRWRTRL